MKNNISEIENNNIIIKNKQEILNHLLSFIESLVYINNDTIGITLDKNIAIFNKGNTLTISKGYQVNIAKQIHLNPRIKVHDFYQDPDCLEEILLNSVEKEKQKRLENKKECNCKED
jgi:hypothetical protein